MFTGIVTDLATVADVAPGRDARRFRIVTTYDLTSIDMGASIACNGCCLTVVEKGPDWFAADASQETLNKTTLGSWKAGDKINLERPLRMGDELGGHMVLGHIDGVAEVRAVRDDTGSKRYTIVPPRELAKFVAAKGSVALDGVSLTVNEVDADSFGVNIIPHTQEVTTFGRLTPGSRVNMEIDSLARYVARLIQPIS
ncbi:MAG: riboflavin synthase [Rhodospirillaceae bacterium]|nr:riboflavin synthase [Rhodospirillaceae bacterium]